MNVTWNNPEQLTPRQLEVLVLIAKGLFNRQIAEKLHIDVHTVDTHVHFILEKLGVTNRVEAAVYAVRNGLVEDEVDDLENDKNTHDH